MNYSEPLGDVWKYDPDYNRTADFLGIDRFVRENVKVASKISYITDWAYENKKSTKIQDALWEINNLKGRLGVNTQGETLVNQLYEFLRLKNDRTRTEPEVPYKEIINQIVKDKRDKQVVEEEKSFKKENKQIVTKAHKDQIKADKEASKTIEDYRKSYKPEPKYNLKIDKPVDSTPQTL